MSPLKYDPVLWLHIRYPEFWIERQTPQCVLTIKLVPWAPALRGPYKVNVKREKCILTRNNKATAWIYINQVEYFILLENRSKKILLWVWHRDRHTELVRMRAKTHEDNASVCVCERERDSGTVCVPACLILSQQTSPAQLDASPIPPSTETEQATHGWQWQQASHKRHTNTHTYTFLLLSCLLPSSILTFHSEEQKQSTSRRPYSLILCVHSSQTFIHLSFLFTLADSLNFSCSGLLCNS